MKLIIEIPLESNDLQEGDFSLFIKEAVDATWFNMEIGRPVSEEEQEVGRLFSVSGENFTARVEL